MVSTPQTTGLVGSNILKGKIMYNPQVGDPLEKLDTPAMVIDLDLMEANIARLFELLASFSVAVRPHLKTVKSPALAHKLMAAGAIGGCVAKISEAEVMVEAGIEDLLITTEIVGPVKVERLVRLAQAHPQLKIVVDNIEGAEAIHRAIQASNGGRQAQPLQVLIDINVGQNRTGVQPGEAALRLARQLADLDSLRLVGLQGYEGHLQHVQDRADRAEGCQQAMQKLTDTAQLLKKAGYPISIVTTGGTGTAEICAAYEGVTEVQPGSFIFMDTDYRNALGSGSFSNALSILATVISRPAARQAVIDAGLKSLSTDSGMAEPKGWPGLRYRPGGDEHGILEWEEGTTAPALGDRIEMIPSHIDTTVNLHDYYYGCRKGKIETIWPVATRGKVQ